MQYDTSLSRRENFLRNIAINVPDHIDNEPAYVAAARGSILNKWVKGNRKRWFEAHADAQRLQDWLFGVGEFEGKWDANGNHKPHPMARNVGARGGFNDLLAKLAADLEECGGLSEKQTQIVRNALARQFQFAEERKAKFAEANARDAEISQWIGEVGKRQDFELEVRWVKAFEGIYGTSYIHGLRDAAGNSVIYKGSNKLGEKGDQIKVKASIKEHGERDGVKQTIIARPKLIEEKQ